MFQNKMKSLLTLLNKYKYTLSITSFIFMCSIVSTYCFTNENIVGIICSYTLIFMLYSLVYGYEIQMLKERIGTAETVKLDIQILDGMPIPEYENEVLILKANNTCNINPYQLIGVSAGFKVNIPKGYELQITSIYSEGIVVNNGIQRIGWGNMFSIAIELQNNTASPILLTRGEPIAQAVLVKTANVILNCVNRI